MKNKKRFSAPLAAGLAASLVLAGCSTTGDSTAATETSNEGSATVDSFKFVSQEPVTMDIRQSSSNLDSYVFYLTNAMLYRSIDGEVVPELCDNLEVSEDGLTYTYTIKDATYSDGTAITAADIEYGIEQYYITSETYTNIKGGQDFYENGLDDCEGVYTLDEKTVVVELETPTTAFTGELEVYPINREWCEEQGSAYGGTPESLQYSGPYILTDWTVGSSMTFEKNESYINADELFPTKTLTLLVSTDESTTYSLYLNQEADAIISINATLAEMLGEDTLTWASSGNLIGLEFNTTGYTYSDGDGFVSRGEDVTALMQNENFRKALAYALDREGLTSAVDSASSVTNRYVSSYITLEDGTSYTESTSLSDSVPTSGDAELAQQYLAAALEELGYSDVSELPELTYLTFETSKQKLIAETAVSLWKSVLGLENITINLQPIQSAIMSMVYMDFDIYLQQLSLSKDDEVALFSYWTTQGGVSDPAGFQTSGVPSFMASMHADEEYDALVAAAYTDFNEMTHFEKVNELEQMLYDSYVYFPLMEGGTYYTSQSYVEGFIDTGIDDAYSFAHLVVYEH